MSLCLKHADTGPIRAKRGKATHVSISDASSTGNDYLIDRWLRNLYYYDNNFKFLTLLNHFQFTAWVGKVYWLGLNDLQNDGDFRWDHDGEAPEFTGWGGVEPNGGASENCVVKGENWWNDLPCSSKRLTVCEFWQLLSFPKYTDQCFWVRHLPFKHCCRWQYIFAENHICSSVTHLTKYL